MEPDPDPRQNEMDPKRCYLALAFQPLGSLKSRKIVLFPGTHSTRQELLVKGSTQPSQDIYHQEALFSSRSRENRVYKKYVFIYYEVVDTYCRVGRNNIYIYIYIYKSSRANRPKRLKTWERRVY